MLNRIFKVALLVILLIAFAYVGMCTYTTFVAKPDAGPKLPTVEKAAYSLQIKNTGNVILSNNYEVIGEKLGERVFILHGFWELIGQNFRYKDSQLVLDEKVFGEIILRRR